MCKQQFMDDTKNFHYNRSQVLLVTRSVSQDIYFLLYRFRISSSLLTNNFLLYPRLIFISCIYQLWPSRSKRKRSYRLYHIYLYLYWTRTCLLKFFPAFTHAHVSHIHTYKGRNSKDSSWSASYLNFTSRPSQYKKKNISMGNTM